ncbi:MAG: ABC transporter permease [Anaerolineales bacterium]|nr:ABC transporter permease [Anaerolineales bacterium]
MTSRWKKVWADFWGNKSRAVLTILTITVGVFAVGFNNNAGLYMIESMDSDFLSVNPSEAIIYAYPMDDHSVEIAREVAGVDAVEGRSTASAFILQAGKDDVPIQFTAVEDPLSLTVDILKPALGQASIAPLGEKDVLIDSSAAPLGYQPGDMITVELGNGKIRELRLAGYLHAAAGIPYSQTGRVNAYVTPATISRLGGSRDFNALAISVSENQTDAQHVAEVAQAVIDRLEKSGIKVDSVAINNPGHHFAYTISQGLFLILGIIGWLAVVLGGVLIVNTITALMSQQKRQIGIMKAIGGDGFQIFGMYVVLILFFGLGALAISVPLANIAAKAVGDSMSIYLNFFPATYGGYTSTLIQQTIIALVVPLVAALAPMYNTVRVTVREALTDYGIGGSAKPKEKGISKAALLIPRPMRLSLRNAFRRKARLTLTLFTLVLAGATFISIYNLWASFGVIIDNPQAYGIPDIRVTFGHGYRFDKVSAVALSVPGVEAVEGWLDYPGKLDSENKDEAGRQVLFSAPPSGSALVDPVISGGRWLEAGDDNAIVVANQMLDLFPDLKIGDTLTIEINGKETKWSIIGIYTSLNNSPTQMFYANYEYLSQVIGQPGMVYSLHVITRGHDMVAQKTVNEQLLTVFEAGGVQVSSTQLGAVNAANQRSLTNLLVGFMLMMAALIAVVGGLGLMGTMGINVLERTREIGVLRAVGASNFDVQSIVIVEGIVVGMISWVISILLSIPLTGLLAGGVGTAMFKSPLPTVYDSTGTFVWLIFMLFLATLASSLPARRASRLTVKDTLAYE